MKKIFYLPLFATIFLLFSVCAAYAQIRINDLTGINVRATDLAAPKQRFTWVREFHDWSNDIGFPNPYSDTLARFGRSLDPINPSQWNMGFNPSYDQTGTYLSYNEYYAELQGRVIPVLKGIAPFMRGILNYPDACGIIAPLEQKPVSPLLEYENLTGNCDLPLLSALPIPFVQRNAETYTAHAFWMSLFAAKYGQKGDWNEDFVQQYLSSIEPPASLGQGWIHYFEDNNETNKTWYDRGIGINNFSGTTPTYWYFSPQEYAAMFSADYDGHENTLTADGKPLGVINAAPGSQMVMAGLAGLHGKYLTDMKDHWTGGPLTQGRPTGTVPNFVANFHHYCTNVTRDQQTINQFFGSQGEFNNYTAILVNPGGGGVSPEADNFRSKLFWLRDALQFSFPTQVPEYWLSEFGYDSYDDPFDNSSGVDVPIISGPAGTFDPQTVQAQWLVRGVLEAAWSKAIDKIMLFELLDHPNFEPGTYAHSGLLTHEGKAKRAWYYIMTLKAVLGEFSFNKEILNGSNGISVVTSGQVFNQIPRVYEFKKGSQRIFAIWSPTQEAQQYTVHLTFPNNSPDYQTGGKATLIQFEDLNEEGRRIDWSSHIQGRKVSDIPVTETPVFLILNEASASPTMLPVKKLRVQPMCCGGVRLAWDLPGNNENTLIFYQLDTIGGAAPDFKFTDCTLWTNNLGGNRTSTFISGLKPNQKYHFWVFPIGATGNPQDNLTASASRITATTVDCTDCLVRISKSELSVDAGYDGIAPVTKEGILNEAAEMLGANDAALVCQDIFDPNPVFTYQGVSGNGFNGWGSESWIQPSPEFLELIPELNTLYIKFKTPKKIRGIYAQDWVGNGRVVVEYRTCACPEWQRLTLLDLEGQNPGRWIYETDLPVAEITELRLKKQKSDAVLRQLYFCGEDVSCSAKVPQPKRMAPGQPEQLCADEIRTQSAALRWSAVARNVLDPEPVFFEKYEVRISQQLDKKGDMVNPVVFMAEADRLVPRAIFRLNGLTPGTQYYADVQPMLGRGADDDPCATNSEPPGVKRISFRTEPDPKSISSTLVPVNAGFAVLLNPNPVQDMLNVTITSGALETVAIIGADGRVLQELMLSDMPATATLDVANLPAGAYWVRVLRTDMSQQTVFMVKTE